MMREPNAQLIREKLLPFTAVHGERQTGKSTALLQAVSENDYGRAIIVAMNHNMVRELAYRWQSMYQPARFGSTGRSTEEPYPRFISADNVHRALEGSRVPFYVDEWWMLPMQVREKLIESGRLKAAVGTVPHGEQIPLFMPRPRSYFEAIRASLCGCSFTKHEAAELKRMIDISTQP